MPLSQYRSRSAIKSCNRENQICGKIPKKRVSLPIRLACGIKSGKHSTFLARKIMWLPRGSRAPVPFWPSAGGSDSSPWPGRRLGAFAQRDLALCTCWATCREAVIELFGLFFAQKARDFVASPWGPVAGAWAMLVSSNKTNLSKKKNQHNQNSGSIPGMREMWHTLSPGYLARLERTQRPIPCAPSLGPLRQSPTQGVRTGC